MIGRAAEILRAGGLVAFPTETVYGLGADARNSAAVRRIFAAKGRPATNPLIVHVHDVEVAKRYAEVWPEAATELAREFWPGPLTMVLPKSREIVDEATAGKGTVGLRVPRHAVALQLLREFDGPVAAPSANRSNHVSPTTAQHVRDELGDRVDLILEGGACEVGIESTVLDLSGERAKILRPGGVTREMIEAVIGKVDLFEGAVKTSEAAVSPGQHEKHYSPVTPAVRFERGEVGEMDLRGCGVLVLGKNVLSGAEHAGRVIQMPAKGEEYAAKFYAVLREVDEMGLKGIYIEMPPDLAEWVAVRDRIRRATVPLQ